MSPRTVEERPRHNPHWLHCPFSTCRRSFRNQTGLTSHIRSSCHRNSGHWQSEATLPQARRQHEAHNTSMLPIHRSDESSSQGNQLGDSTPFSPSTPLPRFSPAFSFEINQTPFNNNTRPSSQVQESPHKISTPEADEPLAISKVFHPIING